MRPRLESSTLGGRRQMLVLFDVDDTLLDDAAATREAVDALREHLGLDVPAFEFRSRWFDSLRHPRQ
jgi:phosphoglycolate phosphatase-like HAD superfamily hydrolase